MTRKVNLSATNVASWLEQDCMRRLVYETTTSEALMQHGVRTNLEVDPTFPQLQANRLLFKAGLGFEKELYDFLVEVAQVSSLDVVYQPSADQPGGYGHVSTDRVQQLLTNPPTVPTVILQAELPVTLTFTNRWCGTVDPTIIRRSNAILDILHYDAESGQWIICDVKKSKEATNRHRYQVAFYWLVLESWLAELGLTDGVRLAPLGYIYLKKEGVLFPGEPFDLGPYLARVRRALGRVIPKALGLALDHHDWQVVYSCEKCDYYLHCRQDSQLNHYLSEIPFLTKTAKQYLNAQGIFTLEQLQTGFQTNPQLGDDCLALAREKDHVQARLSVVLNTLNNQEPRQLFLRKPCPTMPDHGRIHYPIFLSSEQENLHGYTHQISVMYRDKDCLLPLSTSGEVTPLLNKDQEPTGYYFRSWIMEQPTDEEQVRVLVGFLHILTCLLEEVVAHGGPQWFHHTSHIFAFDSVDVRNIYDACLSFSESSEELQRLVEDFMQYFPPTQEHVAEDEDPQMVWQVPFTLLSAVLRRTLALPVVTTAWRIQEVWRRPDGESLIKVPRPRRKYLREMSNQVSVTFSDDYWAGKVDQQTLDRLVAYKTKVCRQIYWELFRLNDPQHYPSLFTLYKPPLQPPRRRVEASNDLPSLATALIRHLPDDSFVRPLNYFHSIETLNQSLEYYRRLYGDLRERQLVGTSIVGLVLQSAELPGGRKTGFVGTFRSTNLNTSKLKLKRNSNYLLTDEMEADAVYGWTYDENKDHRVQLISHQTLDDGRVELQLKFTGRRDVKHPSFQDVWMDAQQVHLQPHHYQRRFVLDEVQLDFTGPTISDFLISFAFQRLSGQFPPHLANLLPDGNPSLQQVPPLDCNSPVLSRWLANPNLRQLTNFNDAQRQAVASTYLNPLTLVWGPPGTGKTRVIAWAIVTRVWANQFRSSVQELKIALVAFTNRAIDNALEKVLEALQAYITHEPALLSLGPIHLFRAKGKQSFDYWYYDGQTPDLPQRTLTGPTAFDTYKNIVRSPRATVVVAGTVYQLNHLTNPDPYLTEAHEQLNNVGEVRRKSGFYKSPTPIIDLLVVDEASQLKVIEFFMASFVLRPNAKLLVVGDDKQLPPVIVSPYPVEFKERIGSIYSYIKQLDPSLVPVMLDRTYRFNPTIADFPSATYYDGQLVSQVGQEPVQLTGEPDGGDFFWSVVDPEKPTVLVTYSGPLRAQDNEYEAELVAQLVHLYSERAVDPSGNLYSDSLFTEHFLGIITPHNAQINAIKNALILAGVGQERHPVVDTVDKYQGQERDVVIISYGVSDPDYAESEAEFILSPNRFNVSITRPKQKYIVVMSEMLLDMLPEDQELVHAALELQAFREHFNHVEEFTLHLTVGELRGRLYY